MNESIIYLKKEYYGAFTLAAVNKENKTCIEVFRTESINIDKDIEDCEERVGLMVIGGFKLTDRETFNKAFLAFTTNLNELSKEL